MVRKEVSSDDASATFWKLTLVVPQVSSGIIRLPMAILRITFSTAAAQSGVDMERKNIPMLLITSATEPMTKIFLIPILSYILPAKGLTTAVAREPGSVTRPDTAAEYPMTSWTYSGIITDDPIMTR